MSFGDFKLIVFFLLVLGGGYYLLSNEFTSRRNWRTFRPQPAEPTIKFVAPGTPGAKTWIQLQEERGIRYR
jgi:hypothetical protein